MNIDEIRFERGAIRPLDCVSDGWNLISQNIGLYIAIGLITFLMLGCLIFIQWFLFGPIVVGLYYVLLRQFRGESVDVGMMFKGFGKFLPAMVVGILMMLPAIANQLLRVGMNLAELMAVYNPSELSAAGLMLLSLGSFAISGLVILSSILLQITFQFAFPLFVDYDFGLMDTIKLSARAGWANAGKMFLVSLLCGLIILVGVLACCVGLIFAIPLVWAANTIAYTQVFPQLKGNEMAPPTPDQYSFQ